MSDFEVRIDKIVAGGDGLGRHEGRVVFVPGTAPGEFHRVRTTVEKKDYARARSVERIESSPDRRDPPCAYYESCGGCSLMHLEPEAQLEAKKRILLEGLERALGAPYEGPLRLRSADEVGYRNRLRFHVVFARGRAIAGFHKRESREIVDVERCLLGTPTLNDAWGRLRRAIGERRPLARSLLSVELEESTQEPGRIAARFFVSSIDALRRLDESACEGLRTEVGLDGLEVSVAGGGPLVRSGRTSIEHRVAKAALQQSLGSFFQSNRFLLGELVDSVVAPNPDEPAAARALDLYCGVGLFALALAGRVESVVGVETETLALRDARANAERAGFSNVRFVRSDAAGYVDRASLREGDVVVLDPPRGGVPRALLEALGRSPLRSVRYVSCDAPTLFRDAKVLRALGFRIDSLELLDLFPNTHHFETVARFSRAP
jgi:23S rRNA (uracil1939-C5)-methyltransferase